MSVSQVKSLINLGRSRRGLNWKDERDRSPKAMGDWSGIIVPRVTAKGEYGIQDFDYELLSNIYICNDIAWTCINLVSSTAALAELKVRKKDDSTFAYLPDHPLQKLLDFPNASMTQFDLIQAYVTHQLLYGNITALLLRAEMSSMCPLCTQTGEPDCIHKLWYDSTSEIQQIMPVHPSNIEHEYVESLGKTCMFYVPDAETPNQKYIVHPDNVLTDPLYNPDVSWYGVSPTFLLQRWLNLDETMTKQVSNFFENGAIPSMIISLKPGNSYTYEEEPATLVQKMKENWMKNFASDGETSKAPAFVFGDIDVQRLEEKIDQAISKGLYYEIQNRVCATYGVPPTLYEMGLRYGAQRASAEQHEKDFYNRTISKILKRYQNKITQLVVPSYDDGIEVVWDLSELGIAAFLIEKKEQRIQKHWELGLIQRNKAQMLLGYEPDTSDLGDDYYRITVMSDGTSQVSNQLDNNLRVPAPVNE